jgi:hypothetical protein
MWGAFGAFLLMQRFFRVYWGYRAFEAAGSDPDRVEHFRRYQLLTASVLVDGFHCLYFATAWQLFRTTSLLTVFVWIVPLVAVTLGRLLVTAVRCASVWRVNVIFASHVVSLAIMLYFTIDEMTFGPRSDYSETVSAGTNLSPRGVFNFHITVAWLAIAVKLWLLGTWLGVRELVNSAAMAGVYPSHHQLYLINEGAAVGGGLSRREQASSAAGTSAPVRLSTALVYDATVRVARTRGSLAGTAAPNNNDFSAPMTQTSVAPSSGPIHSSEAMVPSQQLF